MNCIFFVENLYNSLSAAFHFHMIRPLVLYHENIYVLYLTSSLKNDTLSPILFWQRMALLARELGIEKTHFSCYFVQKHKDKTLSNIENIWYLDTFFDNFWNFLKDSVDVFYGTKSMKSIDYSKTNWFLAVSPIKKSIESSRNV